MNSFLIRSFTIVFCIIYVIFKVVIFESPMWLLWEILFFVFFILTMVVYLAFTSKKSNHKALNLKSNKLNSSFNKQYIAGDVFKDFPNGPQMIVLPSGSCFVGTDVKAHKWSAANEYSMHTVNINYVLAVGQYPVTFHEWDACFADQGIHYQPSDNSWGRGNRPVINVSWNDTQNYIDWLNKKLQIEEDDPCRYRLLSEAEWEYACHAGVNSQFNISDNFISDNCATFNASVLFEGLIEQAGKKHDRTTPVGTYEPNAWGLYDMHGNVAEIVQDNYIASYLKVDTEKQFCLYDEDDNVWKLVHERNFRNHLKYHDLPSDGCAFEADTAYKVLRGGSWESTAINIRSASRNKVSINSRRWSHGFRVAKTVLLPSPISQPRVKTFYVKEVKSRWYDYLLDGI